MFWYRPWGRAHCHWQKHGGHYQSCRCSGLSFRFCIVMIYLEKHLVDVQEGWVVVGFIVMYGQRGFLVFGYPFFIILSHVLIFFPTYLIPRSLDFLLKVDALALRLFISILARDDSCFIPYNHLFYRASLFLFLWAFLCWSLTVYVSTLYLPILLYTSFVRLHGPFLSLLLYWAIYSDGCFSSYLISECNTSMLGILY